MMIGTTMYTVQVEELCGDDIQYAYSQLPLLQARLDKNTDKKNVFKFIDLKKGFDWLVENNLSNTYLVEDKFIVSYIVTDGGWCTTGRHLSELCIIDLYRDRPGTLEQVLSFLKYEAHACGAALVSVGTSLHLVDDNMVQQLQAAGFQSDSHQHTWEVPPAP